MDDPIQRIKSANEIKASKALEMQRHEDMNLALINVQETILKSFTSLVNYLDGKVTKTVVVNQLEEIGTPDALRVVESVNSLHETIKTHKDTDLTELTKLMTEMLAEAKMIPKDHMKMPEMKMMDYSAQLKELGKAVKAVETVIKAQKLVVEAPVVNVDAPIVNIPPPDLKPLQGGLKDVVSAIKKMVIPEYKTDNKAVEALIKKSNDLLKKLLEKPVSSGGGGSGRVSPYQDSAGVPAFVELITSTVTPAIKGIPIVNPDGTNIGGGAGGGLTNTELRATAVPVSGTFYQATQPVSGTVNTGLIPTGTVLNTYSVRLTTNTTTTPIASTAYISSVVINSEVAGTTSTVTIQDKQGTPLKLINGLTTVSATTAPVPINFNTPIKMVSGIDIVTAGAVAATVDIWINYFA